jgi:hydroxyacylglutathione hydrolase
MVVDPAEAAPVLAEAERGWTIGQIWNTHWHGDHTGGNAAIKAATGATVIGPAAEAAKIPTLDVRWAKAIPSRLGAFATRDGGAGAHRGHIAYYLPEAGIAFVGDTLFAMGCGRLFEGTAAQMWPTCSGWRAPARDRSIARTNIPSRTAAMRWSPSPKMKRSRRMRESMRARPRRADRADDDRAGTRDQSLHARGQCR